MSDWIAPGDQAPHLKHHRKKEASQDLINYSIWEDDNTVVNDSHTPESGKDDAGHKAGGSSDKARQYHRDTGEHQASGKRDDGWGQHADNYGHKNAQDNLCDFDKGVDKQSRAHDYGKAQSHYDYAASRSSFSYPSHQDGQAGDRGRSRQARPQPDFDGNNGRHNGRHNAQAEGSGQHEAASNQNFNDNRKIGNGTGANNDGAMEQITAQLKTSHIATENKTLTNESLWHGPDDADANQQEHAATANQCAQLPNASADGTEPLNPALAALREGNGSGFEAPRPEFAFTAVKYEWKDEYGDIAPVMPSLEMILYKDKFRNKVGENFDNMIVGNVDVSMESEFEIPPI